MAIPRPAPRVAPATNAILPCNILFGSIAGILFVDSVIALYRFQAPFPPQRTVPRNTKVCAVAYRIRGISSRRLKSMVDLYPSSSDVLVSIMKYATPENELLRLRREQSKTRQDKIFGGLSHAERAVYNTKQNRIHELER